MQHCRGLTSVATLRGRVVHWTTRHLGVNTVRPMMDTRKSLLLLFAATQLTCASGLFTAPAGASFTCTANPPFIAAFGDVSVISVLIIEPAGFPVPDGTVASFFATQGRVDAPAKTKDGIPRANFLSDNRSGIAQISRPSRSPPPPPSPPPPLP